jgi:crotonobetainyl-CoA:carnitine CoA-transferase CaiB-like acyl-CoA transferase
MQCWVEPFRVQRSGLKNSETAQSFRTIPVGFGESTAAILGEIGYTPEEIEALAEKEVI